LGNCAVLPATVAAPPVQPGGIELIRGPPPAVTVASLPYFLRAAWNCFSPRRNRS